MWTCINVYMYICINVHVYQCIHVYMATHPHFYMTSLMVLVLIFLTLPYFDSYASTPCFMTYSMKERMVKPSFRAML